MGWSRWLLGWWKLPLAESTSRVFGSLFESRNELLQNAVNAVRMRDRDLERDRSWIEWRDFGASQPEGGGFRKSRISSLARTASSDIRKGKWLVAVSRVFAHSGSPIRILELGTCLGSGGDYLLAGAPVGSHYVGMEGSRELANRTAERLAVHSAAEKTVEMHPGPFKKTLPGLISEAKAFDVIFLDGFHEGRRLEEQWEALQPLMNLGTWVVVDDIRWSRGMYASWIRLTQKQGVVALDLFRMGVLRMRVPSPQNQPLRTKWAERA